MRGRKHSFALGLVITLAVFLAFIYGGMALFRGFGVPLDGGLVILLKHVAFP